MVSKNGSGKARRLAPGLAELLDWMIRSPGAGQRRLIGVFRTLALVSALFGSCSFAEAPLKPGDIAPDFSLPGSDGKMYKLSDFHGKKVVVLAWFPKAFTGG